MIKFLDLIGLSKFKKKLVNHIEENDAIITSELNNKIGIDGKIFFYTGATTDKFTTNTFYRCKMVKGDRLYCYRSTTSDFNQGNFKLYSYFDQDYINQNSYAIFYRFTIQGFYDLNEDGSLAPTEGFLSNQISVKKDGITYQMFQTTQNRKDKLPLNAGKPDRPYIAWSEADDIYVKEYEWEPVETAITSNDINNLFI